MHTDNGFLFDAATTRKSALPAAGAENRQRIDDTNISIWHRFNAQIQSERHQLKATTATAAAEQQQQLLGECTEGGQ